MKTAATPLRSLLLTLGALALVTAAAWSVHARSKTAGGDAGQQPAPQTVETAAARPATPVAVTAPAPEPAQAAPGEAGMKAYVDPETGALTNIPPQSAVVPLAEQPVRPDRLPEVTLPDGSVMVDLQGMFEETMVVTVDADGRRRMSCVEGSGEAQVRAGAPAATREVK